MAWKTVFTYYSLCQGRTTDAAKLRDQKKRREKGVQENQIYPPEVTQIKLFFSLSHRISLPMSFSLSLVLLHLILSIPRLQARNISQVHVVAVEWLEQAIFSCNTFICSCLFFSSSFSFSHSMYILFQWSNLSVCSWLSSCREVSRVIPAETFFLFSHLHSVHSSLHHPHLLLFSILPSFVPIASSLRPNHLINIFHVIIIVKRKQKRVVLHPEHRYCLHLLV